MLRKCGLLISSLAVLAGCVGATPNFDDSTMSDDAENNGAADEQVSSNSVGNVRISMPGPCACLASREYPRRSNDSGSYSGGLVRGTVSELGDAAIRLEVTELVDVLWNISVGEEVGGELDHLCPGGEVPALGADVLAQFHYNDPDDSNCAVFRQCVEENCTPPGDSECGCYERHEQDCQEAYKLEGRVTLLDEADGTVTYEWEGESREAPLDELMADECRTKHLESIGLDPNTPSGPPRD